MYHTQYSTYPNSTTSFPLLLLPSPFLLPLLLPPLLIHACPPLPLLPLLPLSFTSIPFFPSLPLLPLPSISSTSIPFLPSFTLLPLLPPPLLLHSCLPPVYPSFLFPPPLLYPMLSSSSLHPSPAGDPIAALRPPQPDTNFSVPHSFTFSCVPSYCGSLQLLSLYLPNNKNPAIFNTRLIYLSVNAAPALFSF